MTYMKFKRINLSKLVRGGYSPYRNGSCQCNSSVGGGSGACDKNAPLYSRENGSGSASFGCADNSERGGANRNSNGNTNGNSYGRTSNAYGTGKGSLGYGSNNNSGSGIGYTPRESSAPKCTSGEMRDRGNEPVVFDIRKEAFMTPDFRTALWTGGNLQLTVMTIPVGEEIGVEMHEGLDQLIGVISGAGEVVFGNRENYFAPPLPLDAHSVVLIPAGTYHNVKNVGKTPLKLYSVYAPRAHKFGTVDKTNPHGHN